MNSIKRIWNNKWFKFSLVTTAYLLWFVVWMQCWWTLFGVIVIYDLYISKHLYRWIWAPHQRLKERSKSYKSAMGWVESIAFAVVVASLFRIFFLEMYVIPTPSMEKTLLVGDYLAVSKVSYGPKLPNTPLSFPLVHNTLPFSTTKSSFVDWITSSYKRLKGFGEVGRNDVVVFNFPEGDTVAMISPQDSYYRLVRAFGREQLLQNTEIVVRPVDKKDNYIKRCVAIAGDTLRIVESNVFVNGQPQITIPEKQYDHIVQTNGTPINPDRFRELGIAVRDVNNMNGAGYLLPLTAKVADKIRGFSNVISVTPYVSSEGVNPDIFPHDTINFPWSDRNFGPLWIPKRGETVTLTLENLPLYQRIIDVYEGNKLSVKNGVISINGTPTDKYTFKMNYYFMMGDNRNNSLDSRYWGFVPEDHVVGKASFIWMSSDSENSFPKNIRWSRIGNLIK